MKNMKVLALTAGVGTLIFAGTAPADFQGISITSSANAYGVTYQVFVDVEAGGECSSESCPN